MKLKVCGMKFLENIESAIDLRPDYMGFIFYEKSTRNYEGDGLDLPSDIESGCICKFTTKSSPGCDRQI